MCTANFLKKPTESLSHPNSLRGGPRGCREGVKSDTCSVFSNFAPLITLSVFLPTLHPLHPPDTRSDLYLVLKIWRMASCKNGSLRSALRHRFMNTTLIFYSSASFLLRRRSWGEISIFRGGGCFASGRDLSPTCPEMRGGGGRPVWGRRGASEDLEVQLQKRSGNVCVLYLGEKGEKGEEITDNNYNVSSDFPLGLKTTWRLHV